MQPNKGKGYTKSRKVTKWQCAYSISRLSLYLAPKFQTMNKILIIIAILNLPLFAFTQNTLPGKNVVSFHNTQLFGETILYRGMADSLAYEEFSAKRIALAQQADSNYTWMWNSGTNIWNITPQRKVVDYIIDGNNNVTGFTAKTWANSQWNNSAKYTQTFNSDKYMTGRTIEYWYNNAWINSNKNTYTYDSNNNCLNSLQQDWVSGGWTNASQTISTYSLNNLTSSLTQTWTGGAWVNVDRQTYSYNANNLCTNSLSEHWNGNSWENAFLGINTFDTNNDMVTSLSQFWNGSNWENSWLNNNIFDNQHRIISSVYKIWNGVIWENNMKRSITYHTASLTSSDLRQVWDGTNWVNDYRRTSSFNASDKEVKNANEKWENMAWIITNTGSFTYDSNNFCTSASFRQWDNSGVNVVSGDSTFYFGGGPTVISAIVNIHTGSNAILVFPNPTEESISITTSLKYESLKILNASGQVVLESKQREQPLHVGFLAKGIYFVQILNDEEKIIKTEKFIKN